jgi:hypothetical protein
VHQHDPVVTFGALGLDAGELAVDVGLEPVCGRVVGNLYGGSSHG